MVANSTMLPQSSSSALMKRSEVSCTGGSSSFVAQPYRPNPHIATTSHSGMTTAASTV
jgi:hypothetical protein